MVPLRALPFSPLIPHLLSSAQLPAKRTASLLTRSKPNFQLTSSFGSPTGSLTPSFARTRRCSASGRGGQGGRAVSVDESEETEAVSEGRRRLYGGVMELSSDSTCRNTLRMRLRHLSSDTQRDTNLESKGLVVCRSRDVDIHFVRFPLALRRPVGT